MACHCARTAWHFRCDRCFLQDQYMAAISHWIGLDVILQLHCLSSGSWRMCEEVERQAQAKQSNSRRVSSTAILQVRAGPRGPTEEYRWQQGRACTARTHREGLIRQAHTGKGRYSRAQREGHVEQGRGTQGGPTANKEGYVSVYRLQVWDRSFAWAHVRLQLPSHEHNR